MLPLELQYKINKFLKCLFFFTFIYLFACMFVVFILRFNKSSLKLILMINFMEFKNLICITKTKKK